MQFQLNSSTAFRLIPNTNSYSGTIFPRYSLLGNFISALSHYTRLLEILRVTRKDSPGEMTCEVRIVSIAWTSRAHVAPLRLFHSREYRVRGFLVARHPFPFPLVRRPTGDLLPHSFARRCRASLSSPCPASRQSSLRSVLERRVDYSAVVLAAPQ